MDKIILILKDLRIAYECAVNYDNVPNKDEADELIKEMLPDFLGMNKDQLKIILEKYEGNSLGNIINYIIDCIDDIYFSEN